MDLWLEAPWGDRYKIAPLNFKQYAAKFYPETPEGYVPQSAYAHWIHENDYHHLSEFTLAEISASQLMWIGTADEFNENLNGREKSEGEGESSR